MRRQVELRTEARRRCGARPNDGGVSAAGGAAAVAADVRLVNTRLACAHRRRATQKERPT